MSGRRFTAGTDGAAGERGAALAMVLLVGSILMMLTSVMLSRGVRQFGNTGGDRSWEQALNVAEAGMEYAINERNLDYLFTTGETVPAFDDRRQERDWVVAAAASRPTITTPEGEFAIVVPQNQQVLFSVGYVPNRDAESARARVVRREFSIVNYVARNAVLIGGDANLGGNTVISDPEGGQDAHVHANGILTTGNNVTIEGCATSSESFIPAAGDCPASPAPKEWIPHVRVRRYYEYATHAMCPAGIVRGGPLHPESPDPTPTTPCDLADPVVASPAWQYSIQANSWNPKRDDVSGVFYLYHTNFSGKLGKDSQGAKVYATILAEAADYDCSIMSGGHVDMSSGSFIETHPSIASFNTAILAEGDIQYRGGATVIGAVIAREQIDYAGSPESWGPVVAADECDTPFSPVSSSVFTGGAVVNFSGELETLFVAGIRPTDWDEL